MRVRAPLSVACFAGLAIAAVRLPPLTLPFVDREPIHRMMTVFPDRGGWWPDYPRFLDAVRAETRRGDSIALVVPATHWEGGYSYAFYRASYFLAGRDVLPLLTPDGATIRENAARAKFVAFWRQQPPAGARVVYAGWGGALVRR